ncbi:MAG: hypothetical protein JW876_07225 [Candidatus Krumholzibacteriota bacterium]|nr:hypothetical protein [Candidatus Krumholzibacteriota bacterium]
MTTELKRFGDAYASIVVAAYEPLIITWLSDWALFQMAGMMAWRSQKGKYMVARSSAPTAAALYVNRPRERMPASAASRLPAGTKVESMYVDSLGYPIAEGEVQPVKIKGFPEAVRIGDTVYPHGVMRVIREVEDEERSGTFLSRMFRRKGKTAGEHRPLWQTAGRTLPTVLNGRLGAVDDDFDFHACRVFFYDALVKAVDHAIAEDKPPAEAIRSALNGATKYKTYEFLPPKILEEGLSPIGIAHFYRQLYFNLEEGVGPIEEAFTVAPLETLEVVYETTRKQIHEEIVEVGYESVSEKAVESKNLDEISDKVSSMIQRDASASMSANASGSIGVWQAGASASASLSSSTQRNREETSRRVKEITTRASERIRKSYTIKTRDYEETTEKNLTRRLIKNESEHPVSYGLRRVLGKVLVKVQDLGPRLVWQLYIRNPGDGLARSRFVHFREAEPVSVPELPPGCPPRPRGGTDTGSTSSVIARDSDHGYFVTVVINPGADRMVTAVSIDSITDLEGGGKEDYAPSPKNDIQWGPGWDPNTNTYTINIVILPGDSASVSVNYTYAWDPAQEVLDEWEAKRQQLVHEIEQKLLEEQFQREKTLITERSKIKARPAIDLRREERYEIMNRMISQLFGRGDDPAEPVPLEIEYFHRYFDIEGIFVYTHPSWWRPRYSPVSTSFGREAYEITAESEPAPMGVSLGWCIQLDGDMRRNSFLNSPWVRVCLPINPGREREAVEWLSVHVEGRHGYDPSRNPLKGLLEDIDEVRDRQGALGCAGPDYVTVGSDVGDGDPATPAGIYPVIDEFEITLPTDGFVYETLEIEGT